MGTRSGGSSQVSLVPDNDQNSRALSFVWNDLILAIQIKD